MSFVTNLAQVDSNSYVTVTFADDYFSTRLGSSDWTSASNQDKQAALATASREIDGSRFKGAQFRETQALKWPRVIGRGFSQRFQNGNGTRNLNFHFFTASPSSVADNKTFTIDDLKLSGDLPGSLPTNYFKGGQVEIIDGTGEGEIGRIASSNAQTGVIVLEANLTTLPVAGDSKMLIMEDVPAAVKAATCEQALFRLQNVKTGRLDLIAQGVRSVRVGETAETYVDRSGEINLLTASAKDLLEGLISRTGRIT